MDIGQIKFNKTNLEQQVAEMIDDFNKNNGGVIIYYISAHVTKVFSDAGKIVCTETEIETDITL